VLLLMRPCRVLAAGEGQVPWDFVYLWDDQPNFHENEMIRELSLRHLWRMFSEVRPLGMQADGVRDAQLNMSHHLTLTGSDQCI
jgi:hypothetical protein